MTVYGEFEESQLPRPSLFAFAAVGICQLILAVWIAHLSIAATDAYVLRRADVKDVIVLDPVPWGTLKSEMKKSMIVRGESNDLALRVQREFDAVETYVGGGLLAFALVLVFFWPTRPTLARRLFLVTLGECLALFGAAALVNRGSITMLTRESLMPAAIGAAALGLTMAFEMRAIQVLANVVVMQTPLQRLGWWSLRILLGSSAIGFASYLAGYANGWRAAAALAAVTLFPNLVRRPAPRYDRIEEPQMREAAAGMLFVVVVLAGLSIWAFRPFGEHRVVFAEGMRARLVDSGMLGRELMAKWKPPAPPEQRINIRWSRPRAR